MTDLFAVLAPGAFTTVQDAGRFGYQSLGVPVSGALDLFSHQVANLLVGNRPNRACLELTILGPRLEVLAEADLALTGAEMGLTVNGVPQAGWCSVRVRPGDVVEVGQVRSGCRGYLAASGGIDVRPVMGSCSTYVGGKLGGFEGRPLSAGDRLPGGSASLLAAPRVLPGRFVPTYPVEVALRALRGPQDDYFREGLEVLFSSPFLVTAKADRMGYRLQGPRVALRGGVPRSIVSEPSMPGGVQIPPDEQPIVLLVEQTVGGYAKAATVVSSDLCRLAQATPGDTVRFEEIDLAAAHALCREEAGRMRDITALWEDANGGSNPARR
ncbi:MAG: biotin-dependent carboxyltransferase family protein [Proteobacteria bacterium]|nr:biotin-dependent carboxyltransferase family protein [Pseudomonadota bacterium]